MLLVVTACNLVLHMGVEQQPMAYIPNETTTEEISGKE